MLKSIPIEEYQLTPTAFDLPRAMADMKAGDLVTVAPNGDIYPTNHPDAPPHTVFAGVLMHDTFQYGVALIASVMHDAKVKQVWIKE